MAYDVRLVKLVSGEMVLGKYDKDAAALHEVASLQTIPTQQGVQMVIVPFGYPFDADFSAIIKYTHVIYEYKTIPEDVKTRYLEAVSNISLNSGGLGSKLDLSGSGAAPNLSNLIRGK